MDSEERYRPPVPTKKERKNRQGTNFVPYVNPDITDKAKNVKYLAL